MGAEGGGRGRMVPVQREFQVGHGDVAGRAATGRLGAGPGTAPAVGLPLLKEAHQPLRHTARRAALRMGRAGAGAGDDISGGHHRGLGRGHCRRRGRCGAAAAAAAPRAALAASRRRRVCADEGHVVAPAEAALVDDLRTLEAQHVPALGALLERRFDLAPCARQRTILAFQSLKRINN